MLQKKAVEPATLDLLKKISSLNPISDFALAGGTNLALRMGHRISIGLVFFTNIEYSNSVVFKIMTGEFPGAELLFVQNQTMTFSINGIKVDFILYPFQWLKPFELIEKARLISIPNIIPMKLQALGNRFSKKDFWDVAFLLKDFPLQKMMETFSAKFPQIDPGYIIHSLVSFDEAEKDPDPIRISPQTWAEIKTQLKETVIDYTNGMI